MIIKSPLHDLPLVTNIKLIKVKRHDIYCGIYVPFVLDRGPLCACFRWKATKLYVMCTHQKTELWILLLWLAVLNTFQPLRLGLNTIQIVWTPLILPAVWVLLQHQLKHFSLVGLYGMSVSRFISLDALLLVISILATLYNLPAAPSCKSQVDWEDILQIDILHHVRLMRLMCATYFQHNAFSLPHWISMFYVC